MARILVLDDDVATAELIRVVLEDAGYETLVASDPADLPRDPVDCVLTDLMSVDLYSIDGAREWVLRLRDRYPGVPIIVVTAHGEASGHAAALGVQRVIMKPFDVDHLPVAVQAVLTP